MRKKKAVLISSFNYYDIRLKHIEQYLIQADYEIAYITSDFDHIAKERYHIDRVGVVQVHACPYKKNLSLSRMLSHFIWSNDVFRKVKGLEPDLLFVMLPPNSLARYAATYRKTHSSVKLVFDVYDLWPETYPFYDKVIYKLPFFWWRRLRDKYINSADMVTTECDLFSDKMRLRQKGIITKTLYPALDEVDGGREFDWDNSTVKLAYLGSINNIIDISLITQLIAKIHEIKHVQLHIVGAGESLQGLVASVESTGASVVVHGTSYDLSLKQSVLAKCRFGLNIMKENVCVGLTMKSVDYLRFGIPLINNIPGDTTAFITSYGIGINIEDIGTVAHRVAIISETEQSNMRASCRLVYNKFFSTKAFNNTLNTIMEELEVAIAQ